MPEELEVAQIISLGQNVQVKVLGTVHTRADRNTLQSRNFEGQVAIPLLVEKPSAFNMRYFIIVFFVKLVLSFAITPLPVVSNGLSVTPTLSTWSQPVTQMTATTATITVSRAQSQIPLSAVVTSAPLVVNPLEKRQRCWNDQGFSVDCATWTGYYYTWGPPGNPYEGGPGEGGGSGSGSGGNGGGTVVVYQSDGNRLDLRSWAVICGILCLGLLLFI